MIKIIFLCEGNICRSPTAEVIFKSLLKEKNCIDNFEVISRGTLLRTEGRDIYPPMKELLDKDHFTYPAHSAKIINITDFKTADYIIGMEEYNLVSLKRTIFIRDYSKLHLLLDYSSSPKDIEDPYASRDFEKAYKDIKSGCQDLLSYFVTNNLIK